MACIIDGDQLSLAEIWREAGSSPQGLDEEEARKRLASQGENRLAEEKEPSLLRRLLRTLADPMTLILLAASLVSSLVGEWADSAVIIGVVLMNSCLSLYQEGRAQRGVALLTRLNSRQARVRREGILLRKDAASLVVGDVVLVEAGDVVPADMRLISSFSLQVDESSLTGESQPMDKEVCGGPVEKRALADCSHLLFLGSPLLTGRGEGVVIATGMDTQMGRIAGLLTDTQRRPTPLQLRMEELSRALSLAVLIISAVVFALNFGRGDGLSAFLLAISLAVAAVPEGLAMAVTLVLSQGMAAMSKRRALVRRLAAVETLGSVQVICSDKTGTLTQNRLTVVKAQGWEAGLAQAAALCSSLLPSGESYVGDPTELALAHWAAQRGEDRRTALEQAPLLAELPFDSRRKMMSTLHQQGQGQIQYTKGAFERVLACCTRLRDAQGRARVLSPTERRAWLRQGEDWAGQGLRVLAAAERQAGALAEQGLTLLGLFGLADPTRPTVGPAIAAARAAGVITVMVSGDNLATATAISRELGLLTAGQEAVSGEELERMSDQELARRLPRIRVYARVRPEDKLRIVRAWQERGAVVAMTGDGVNDAPALQGADIGCGMGQTGAEVSKAVSALVLADDDYATIVEAIAQGRRVYANIRRAVQFLLASNLAEVLAILAASLLSIRLFLPIHLLWINLITDCLPAAALGAEPAGPRQMLAPPRDPKDSLFSQGLGWAVLRQGLLVASLTLAAFFLGAPVGAEVGTTMAFITLSGAELFLAWNLRSRTRSIFRLEQANPLLAPALLVSLCLNLVLLYWPAARGVFRLAALSPAQLLCSAMLAFAITPLVELDKKIFYAKKNSRPWGGDD